MSTRMRMQALHVAATALAVAAVLTFAGCLSKEPKSKLIRLEIPASKPLDSQRRRTPTRPPRIIEARVGDRLLVTNHDRFLQIVADHPIAAGRTVTIHLNEPGRFATTCSAHRESAATVVVRER